ncbi:MAG: hypothetical protein RR853_08760 [Aurantimicrobium sp.]|uniref:hypothetical protein n=1 Tax=Aurantimicrobium sp. TaxID=1930784 RepID=UPI002FC68438
MPDKARRVLSPEQSLERSLRRALQSELAKLHNAAQEDPQATPRVLDLTYADKLQHATGNWQDDSSPMTADGFALNKQQVYRRRKRALKKFKQTMRMTDAEAAVLYRKPLREWDNEELARGRPRNKDGSFSGSTPEYVTMEMHEEAMDRFTSIVRTGMRVATVDAIKVLGEIIVDEEVDNRGKPVVAAGTKLDAAKFLIEHIIGKPTQHIESDVSVKLQGILGAVMVNPDDVGGYFPGHMPGVTMELAEFRDEDEVDSDG